MSVPSVEALAQYLRRLCDEAVPSDDAVLLKRFVTANDREAFELLLARHGPMVLGTARRLVGNSHDAEDVFQAVFLSLARLATSIRHGRALAAWLHQTTCRIAAKVRADRRLPSAVPPEPYEHGDPAAGLVWREVCQALDEELQRLPDRLRSPLLLCYLSGLTRDEAARQLGWSLATLKRRLEEGRKALRMRLARRGIAAVGLALTVLTPEALQAAPGKALLAWTCSLLFSNTAVVPATIAGLVIRSASAPKGLVIKSTIALLAALAFGVGMYAAVGQADPPQQAQGQPAEVKPAPAAKLVQPDDPLPAGSTLRFGTARFRHGVPVESLAVSADGKLAVAVNESHGLAETRVFDLVSGRALYTLPIWDGSTSLETAATAAAISPDGQLIVTKHRFGLRVCDAATGKELRTIKLKGADANRSGLPQRGEDEWLAFTPDGKAIAVTTQGKVIHLVDFASGKKIRDFRHQEPVWAVAFAPDGKLLAAGGHDRARGNFFARLWDVDTGKELRRFMHGRIDSGDYIPSLAFSPDGKTLATGAGDARLRLFDVATGKLRKAFPADGEGPIDSVAFAPDGKTVAAAGASIRLYDPITGEQRLRIDRLAGGVQFTDGGKTLTGAVSGAIYRWDAATGKALTPESAGDSIVQQIIATADGHRVITRGEDGDAHVWDAATGAHLRYIPVAPEHGLALSPDGRSLVWPAEQLLVDIDATGVKQVPNRLRLYDLAANRFVERFATFKGDAHELAFAPDGKTLVTVDHDVSTVRIWDVAAGKELRSFRVARENERKKPSFVWSASLSPDGATLAVTYQRADLEFAFHPVRLYDVATGTERHELPGHQFQVSAPAFSPDGKLLVTASPGQPGEPVNQVFVWDVKTGARVAPLPNGLTTGAVVTAFAPDGRTVALADEHGTVRLYETATWTVRAKLRGDQRGRVTALAFTPGGQLLTGGVDTTVLAWNVRPPRVALSVPLDSAWQALAARDAGESFKFEGRFLAAPEETVKLFAEKIKPVAAIDAKRVQRLLADLDSDDFAVRDAASTALQGSDQRIIPYLEAALKKGAPSLEFRRRVQRLLEQQQGAAMLPEQLRQIRAVMVLEVIGDGESKKLLKQWAGGPGGARLAMEASAALQRLEAASKARQ